MKHRTKLSNVSPTGREEKHPLFAVKTNLVRLVANLCYQCPAVQMKVGVSMKVGEYTIVTLGQYILMQTHGLDVLVMKLCPSIYLCRRGLSYLAAEFN